MKLSDFTSYPSVDNPLVQIQPALVCRHNNILFIEKATSRGASSDSKANCSALQAASSHNYLLIVQLPLSCTCSRRLFSKCYCPCSRNKLGLDNTWHRLQSNLGPIPSFVKYRYCIVCSCTTGTLDHSQLLTRKKTLILMRVACLTMLPRIVWLTLP